MACVGGDDARPLCGLLVLCDRVGLLASLSRWLDLLIMQCVNGRKAMSVNILLESEFGMGGNAYSVLCC